MSSDLERLVVALEAKTTAFEKAMNRAVGVSNQRAKQIESRFSQMDNRLVGIGKNLFAGFAAGASLAGFERLLDASSRVQNSLKTAGLAGDDLKKVYDSLFASAQRNAAPIEALANLYGRAAQVQNELGASTEQMLNFTDKVALALRVSGQSASQSSGALLQLSQALGSGTVHAEEFNSILEGALPIAQAVAAGLDEAGGSVSKLRQLVIDGKVSSQQFFRAFEAGSSILEDKVAGSTLTVEQGMTKLTNQLIDATGKIDTATGASNQLAGALNWLAQVVEGMGNLFENDPLGIGSFVGDLEDAKNKLREFLGLTGKGSLDDFLEGTNLLEGKFGFASDQKSGTGSTLGSSVINGVTDPGLPAVPGGATAPYLPPSTSAPRTLADLFAGMAGRGQPLVAKPFYDPEEAKNAAAGMREIEDAAIDTSDAVASISPEMEAFNDRIRETEALVQSFAADFVDGLRNGQSVVESLTASLGDLANQLIDMALNSAISGLFGGLFSAPKWNIPGSYVPGGFYPGRADGGYTGPGGKNAPAGLVHAGEVVWSQKDVARWGGPAIVDAMRRGRGYAAGGIVQPSGEAGPEVMVTAKRRLP